MGEFTVSTRVLVADDHTLVRAGLVSLMASAGLAVVGGAADGAAAVASYRAERPDVLLMDLRMPVLDGIGATNAIREEFPHARILILTSFDGDEDVFQALRAGARGYMLKDSNPADLIGAVQSVAAGRKVIPAHISAKLVDRMGSSPLTPREHDVLRQIASGKSNAEIGTALFISEGTVKTHVNSILAKLGVTDRTNAVMTGLRRGLVSLG